MKNWKMGRKLIDVVCANCQNIFKKTESEFNRSEKNNKKHFCSIKCNKDYRKKNSFNLTKKCKFCGSEFIGDNIKTAFCSHKCSASYNNRMRTCKERVYTEQGMKNILNANNKRYNTQEYYINPNYCIECNKILSFGKRNWKFCSIECKKIYDRKNLTEYQKYYKECQFKFNLSDYPNEFNFNLIKEYGWYQAKNHGNNLNGVSRDHMISVKYGYENNISPEIIKHPANCQLMIHNENSSKWKACSITSEELNSRIIEWDNKYGCIHW
jgi:hypothetical protein